MIIYLDWNIIVDLYEQNLSKFWNTLSNRKNNIIIPYSSVHLKEGQKYNNNHREDDILEFISEITKNSFLYVNPFESTINNILPHFVNNYEKIRIDYFTMTEQTRYSEIIDISKQMGFFSQELNNYNHKTIIPRIDQLISQQNIGDKFKEAVNNDLSFNNLVDVFTNFMKMLLLKQLPISKELFTEKYLKEIKMHLSLLLLNGFGYWQEKNDKYSSFENDIYHTIYASYCDYFLTNDKKLFHKVRAVYYNAKIKTKVFLLNQNYIEVVKLISV